MNVETKKMSAKSKLAAKRKRVDLLASAKTVDKRSNWVTTQRKKPAKKQI